ETSWAVIALTDWMFYTRELRGNYPYTVQLNQHTLAQATVTPESVRQGQTVVADISSTLLRDQVNALSITRGAGDGRLYYTTALNLQLPAQDVTAPAR
ncbi:MAG: hypothetical protein ABI700_31515, partial [Chloroflexota bacterium]